MSFYQDSVVQMSSMLRSLQGLLGKAKAAAEARGFPADDYVGYRLSPDMRPLSFQVQAACDAAKFAGARLAGVTPPSNPDTETTMEQLEQRVAATLEFLGSLKPEQFDGAAEREVPLSFMPGKAMTAPDYLREMATPNFYFHVAMAYALLRTSGCKVGKQDFITHLTLHDIAS